MIAWFKSLSLTWKLILIAGILILAVFIYDRFTGGLSDLKGWIFDKAFAERMAKIDELTKANDTLRAQNVEYQKQIVADEAKFAVLGEQDKALDAKQQAELAKVDEALKQQDQEEAITAQPIDDYTRCQRTKDKMIALGIKSAGGVNCEKYKK